MVGIYKIVNPKGKVYIGQSINIVQRFESYKNTLNCKNQRHLYNSLRKYGWNNHIKEVLEECSIEDLNVRERYWQDFYNVIEQGLNCRLTTAGDRTGRNSKESNQRRSESMKGKNKRPRPDVSERNKVVHKGKAISEEHKKRNREKQLGVAKVYGGQNENKKKPVIQWSKENNKYIKEWDSINSAAKQIGRSAGDLHRALNNPGKSCAGFFWTYKNHKNTEKP